MIAGAARVKVVEELPGPYTVIWFEPPAGMVEARPGQFLMVQCGDGTDPYLRYPFSVSRQSTAAADGRRTLWSFLVAGVDTTARWLANRQSGDEVQVIGPLGNVARLGSTVRHVLLAAQDVRIGPLLQAAELAVAEGRSVTMIISADDGRGVYPPTLLPPEVEVIVAGTDRRSGLVASARGSLPWADATLVAADEACLRGLAGEMRRLQYRKPIHALVWRQLPCGTGICGGCPVETRRRGVRLVCRDGPWFSLLDLY